MVARPPSQRPRALAPAGCHLATVPETGRARCDVWRPPAHVPPSGLAMVYLHGSAYYILDKDTGTRPLFRHLTGKGHVIVDVAYRLFPDTDVPGMVADAKRAVAWVKAHATDFGIRPGRQPGSACST